MSKILRLGLLTVMIAGTACATRTTVTPMDGTVEGIGATLAVERFLQAANAVAQSHLRGAERLERVRQELDTMMRLFGTADRPIDELASREDAERRMIALADLLRHRDYRIDGSRLVPGGSEDVIDVLVHMELPSSSVTVPFTVVHAGGDLWRVERIDIQRVIDSGG